MEMLKNRVITLILIVCLYLMFTYIAESYAAFYVALLIMNPIVFLIGGLLYGKVQGFDWLILGLVIILFIPVSLNLFAGWGIISFAGIYAAIMGLGMVIGNKFLKKKEV